MRAMCVSPDDLGAVDAVDLFVTNAECSNLTVEILRHQPIGRDSLVFNECFQENSAIVYSEARKTALSVPCRCEVLAARLREPGAPYHVGFDWCNHRGA